MCFVGVSPAIHRLLHMRRGATGSFNSIRGVPACANHRSMTTWIKNVDGFKGYIVSDQGAAYGIMTDHKSVAHRNLP